jgi:hypothetical protein
MWFHNVIALEPSISVNVFWRGLDDAYYQTKDLYGNRDLLHGVQAIAKANEARQSLSQLPPAYRDFYLHRALSNLNP